MDREGGWGTTSNVDQADINVSFRMGSVPAKAGCTLYRTSGTTTSAIGGYTSPSNYSPNSLNRITIRNTASTFDEQGLALVCRSEEHTSELQSLMRISYAVFR